MPKAFAASALTRASRPWDHATTKVIDFSHVPGGGNVLYLDGHVSFLHYPNERFPMTKNRPALFDFEYHLIFEDVVMRITDSQQPLSFDAYEVGK